MTITQQQALEALDELEGSARGDEPFNHFAAPLLRQYIEQSTAQPQAVVPAMNLLDALKSGNAILIDWPMEPVTPQESLKLMDMMDAEYAKTMGKQAPDDEMAVAMRRVRHMACDLWAWQKEEMRAHFTALAAAQSSAQAERSPVQAVQHVCGLQGFGAIGDVCPACADRASSGATPAGERMPTPEEPEKCYSLDEETFHEFGDFIDMLDEEQAKPGFLVYEGESVRHTASHYARGAVADLFERMGEQAFDDAGEHIGDWPDHAVKGNNSAELEKLIYDWLDANVKVNFYTIKNVREIALTAEMLGDLHGALPTRP